MICARTHIGSGEKILAACDEEVLGKTFKGNGMKIEVFPSFYEDIKVPDEEFILLMRSATIMNLVGEHVIDLAIANGYVKEENVFTIGETKHAQVVKN